MTQGLDDQKDVENKGDVKNNSDIKNIDDVQNNVNIRGSTKQSDKSTEGTVEEKSDENFIDILGNGLLTKKVLVQGNGRESRPDRGDIVTLDIEGHLSDGTAVDKYTAFTFPLGEGDVIQALDLGVSLMEIGETCELFAASKFAYGERGREPDIPLNSDITYTLELLKYEKKPELDKISQEVKLEMGEKKRERGNFLFSRQDFTGAINSYTQAIKILDYPSATLNEISINQQEITDCKLKCCNNLAACQLKVGAYEAAIRSTEIVLLSQPSNVKALFRIGKAHSAKGNTNEGIQYFKKALQLEPESKIIHQELSRLSKKLKSETESEKEMYRRMLGTKNTKTTNKKSGSSVIILLFYFTLYNSSDSKLHIYYPVFLV
ncbi:hypothetical protein LOTGIDRAFT_127555 [Lottia gigantea]|uniref:peptidylprolyl isomerase n=1 Tax=Lottia gigantea TaxID=225164 RepID=V3ZTA0_LOTGI|nr:hypothetical protein LOTGIDRAFT_127555 [Lottia gigantea]ESO87592.1 hypothetical protein LOTGIDRAFT_127555 [Lottia gigantea]